MRMVKSCAKHEASINYEVIHFWWGLFLGKIRWSTKEEKRLHYFKKEKELFLLSLSQDQIRIFKCSIL